MSWWDAIASGFRDVEPASYDTYSTSMPWWDSVQGGFFATPRDPTAPTPPSIGMANVPLIRASTTPYRSDIAATPVTDCNSLSSASERWYCNAQKGEKPRTIGGPIPGIGGLKTIIGRIAGLFQTGDAATKAASWAQYPVVILIGVAVIVIALVAMARPRIASVASSEIGRATGSVTRGLKKIVP